MVDRLTKNTHFIPVKSKWTAPWLAFVYLREIVRLHRVPSSIVSDRDPIFTREFWKSLQEAVGTQLCLSTAYHPQTDGQTERVNHILEDLLRLCILDFGGTWEEHLPLVELPDRLSGVHDVFHGRKCLHKTAEVVEPSLLREVEVERDVTIRRAPTRILGSETRKLRNREVQLVKVQWGEDESNATWETEAKMRSLYPFLFEGMSLLSPLSLSSTYLIFSMSSR